MQKLCTHGVTSKEVPTSQLIALLKLEVVIAHQSRCATIVPHSTLFLQNPEALQVLLYSDEIEVCNPLRSRATVHVNIPITRPQITVNTPKTTRYQKATMYTMI